jgi:hypothetical protein
MKPQAFTSPRASLGLAALACALLLSACGGGGRGPDTTTAGPALVPGTDVPVSATLSADGAFEFVSGLLATTSETGEPIVVGDAVLGTSETDEARALP